MTDSVSLSSVRESIFANEDFFVSPNPASGNVNLTISTTYPIRDLTLRLVDAKGAVIAVQQKSKVSGTASFQFLPDRMAKGLYYIIIYNGEKKLATRSFMKL